MTKFLNISTDNTLGGNSPSDEIVSSQKAIKTYIDTNADNVVWVTYNSTPFADIRAAMQAGKIVLLKYTTNWNEYILRATNLILGATEYIYFTALDTYTHVAYARVSSAEAWIYGGQTNQSSISDLSTIRSGAAAGATAVQPGDLATVATTGAYSDLSGTPTIPTVNNPTITITQGGVTKGSFTLNQASGDTIALDAGGGGSVAIDNSTITKNSSDEIQAVATVNANAAAGATNPLYDWVGTLAEYTSQAVATNHPDWVCYITDDLTAQAYDAYSKSQSDTLLANKANIDLDNLSATGKSTGATLAMPSDTYVDLTLGASGTQYTAPANGWLVLGKISGAPANYIKLYNTTNGMGSIITSATAYEGDSIYVPCKKDDKVLIEYNYSGATQVFRFIYAQGEI